MCPVHSLSWPLGLSALTRVPQKAPQGCLWGCCRSICGFIGKNALGCSPSSSMGGGGLWTGDCSDVSRSFILSLFGSHCLAEASVSKIKCLDPKSSL